ncbi:MAG: hypothetical protein FWC43_09435 [Planctomycetaceae bacterium]|nr:hypothetical protein [Planctomycetaceae bacterium]
MQNKRIGVFFSLALVMCVLTGCPKPRPDGLPELFSCTITIIQGGQPLEGAAVRLVLEGGRSDWTVNGRTDAKGVARISTHTGFAGAPAGTFKVLVSKTDMSPSQIPELAKDATPAERAAHADKVSTEKRVKYNFVKPEFDDAKQTPHTITIAKGKNEATFDVGEAIKEVIK